MLNVDQRSREKPLTLGGQPATIPSAMMRPTSAPTKAMIATFRGSISRNPSVV